MTTANTNPFSQQSLGCRIALLEHDLQEASQILAIMDPASEQQEQERAYLLAWLAGIEGFIDEERLIAMTKPLLESYQIRADFGEGRVFFPRYWLHLGQIALALGMPRDAQTHLEKCLSLIHQRRLAEHDIRSQAAVLLAKATLQGGAPLRAIPLYQSALAVCQGYKQTSFLPDLYAGLAEAYQRTGQLDEAIQSGQRGLDCFVASGGTVTVEHYYQLGDLYWCAQRAEEAIHAYRRVLTLLETNSSQISVVYASMLLVALQFQSNERGELEAWARKAEHALRWASDPRSSAYVMSALGCFENEQAARETSERAVLEGKKKALAWHEKAVEQLLGLQAGTELAEYCMRAALILQDLGRMEEAHVYAKQAASLLIEKK